MDWELFRITGLSLELVTTNDLLFHVTVEGLMLLVVLTGVSQFSLLAGIRGHSIHVTVFAGFLGRGYVFLLAP